MFNDEAGLRNGVTSYFQTNLDSVYGIMMVVFVYTGIVENTRCQLDFDLAILSLMESWYRVPSDTLLSHLLLAFMIL